METEVIFKDRSMSIYNVVIIILSFKYFAFPV